MKISKQYPLHRSKYNVTKNVNSRTYKDVVYDSVSEMKYFIEVVEPLANLGFITHYERQKTYVLQEGFERGNVKVKPIVYKADYYLEYSNGLSEVIDIKGMPDGVAKLKRKMFWKRYPDIDYKWIIYNKKHGGWIDYDELQKILRQEKKAAGKEVKEEDED